jgi:hypothetical protein
MIAFLNKEKQLDPDASKRSALEKVLPFPSCSLIYLSGGVVGVEGVQDPV